MQLITQPDILATGSVKSTIYPRIFLSIFTSIDFLGFVDPLVDNFVLPPNHLSFDFSFDLLLDLPLCQLIDWFFLQCVHSRENQFAQSPAVYAPATLPTKLPISLVIQSRSFHGVLFTYQLASVFRGLFSHLLMRLFTDLIVNFSIDLLRRLVVITFQASVLICSSIIRSVGQCRHCLVRIIINLLFNMSMNEILFTEFS